MIWPGSRPIEVHWTEWPYYLFVTMKKRKKMGKEREERGLKNNNKKRKSKGGLEGF